MYTIAFFRVDELYLPGKARIMKVYFAADLAKVLVYAAP